MLRNEQIVSLCDQLLKAGTQDEAVLAATQLKSALHEHLETIRRNLLVSIAQEIPDETLQTGPLLES